MEKLWVSFFCYTFAALFNEGSKKRCNNNEEITDLQTKQQYNHVQ